MILTRRHQLWTRQYGLGLRVYRDIHRGEGIFSTLKRYALPIGKYLFHNIIKPFVKNNKAEIQGALSRQSMNIIKRLAEGKRPAISDAKQDIEQIFQSKTLSDHLRGEGRGEGIVINCPNNKRRRK